MIVASRYAKSLLDLAIEMKQLEEVNKDMRLIKSVCHQNREFSLLLKSPVISTDKKNAIVKAIFDGKVSKTTSSFLNLLTLKRREGDIEEIANAFSEQYNINKNITTAVITTAVTLDDDTKKKVLEIVKKSATGEVEIIEKIDKNLIGGFVLTVNDKQIDASIKRKLNDLKKGFSSSHYVLN
jgi:F-type H+-transporting ATPase subunit delta